MLPLTPLEGSPPPPRYTLDETSKSRWVMYKCYCFLSRSLSHFVSVRDDLRERERVIKWVYLIPQQATLRLILSVLCTLLVNSQSYVSLTLTPTHIYLTISLTRYIFLSHISHTYVPRYSK